MNPPRAMSLPARIGLLALAAAVCALFVTLGLWQADRAGQKAAMLGAFERALAAEPQPLVDALAGDPALPQRATGSLPLRSDLPWLLLDNQRRGARVGLRAYAIAEPAGHDALLLVEFGWLPIAADRRLPALPPIPDAITVDGILLAPPSPGLRFVTHPLDRAADAVLLTYLDPGELGRELGRAVHPRVLRPDPADPLGFERDLDVLPNTLSPEQHRGYALQWFGLAAAVAAIAIVLLIRSRRR